MSGGLHTALIAGAGRLPTLLQEAEPDLLVCEMIGAPCDLKGDHLRFRIERLVPFLDELADRGIKRVVFAGAMQRPAIDPEQFDPRSAQLVPRLAMAMQAGDDATLRAVIEVFEEWEFEVIGAHEIAPDLLPEAGVLCGTPSAVDEHDAQRGAEIVAALGASDIGQGAVVARGLCLAVETLPGTDAMLEFVRYHKGLRADLKGLKGVFYKAPKPAQDRRADLPAIGVQTVANAAAAGLSGIAFEAGGVMLLDRAAVVEAAQEAGLFLWACVP
ncbi:MAG: UDP-2,3-diacylglucosamine diphosphatase LpxI [Thioclava marina]|uniref:Phosphatidate cytidylyltransferase n=1 Tax=Thioclava marina TaxID=1915077 RepID=A0ABX3MR68_9RHOB|nr:UDP-2,3-diacylglucosamine diphosphatase LpxI [Thioclava marina]MBC7144109.1 UDP-2,3-diacylglucosamine diphosphatase LpxI [Thioclava marina]OOY12543.1 phosphatidate cytidylyltransferase [Thioclava marina]